MMTSALVLTAAVFLAGTAIADAACSTSGLAGSWTFLGTDGDDLCQGKINTTGGTAASCTNLAEGISYTAAFAVKASSACKLTGKVTFGGATYTLVGRVEQATKPGTMTFRIERNGVPWNSAMIAYRN